MPTAHLPIHFKESKNACLVTFDDFGLFLSLMLSLSAFPLKPCCPPQENVQACMDLCYSNKSPHMNCLPYINGLTLVSDPCLMTTQMPNLVNINNNAVNNDIKGLAIGFYTFMTWFGISTIPPSHASWQQVSLLPYFWCWGKLHTHMRLSFSAFSLFTSLKNLEKEKALSLLLIWSHFPFVTWLLLCVCVYLYKKLHHS